jgi:hypothetical protein
MWMVSANPFDVALLINVLTALRLGTHKFKHLGLTQTGNVTDTGI